MSRTHTDELSLLVFIKLHFPSFVFQTNHNSHFFFSLFLLALATQSLISLWSDLGSTGISFLCPQTQTHKHLRWYLIKPNHIKHKWQKMIDSSETRMGYWFWRERKVVEQWSLGSLFLPLLFSMVVDKRKKMRFGVGKRENLGYA